MARLLIAIGLIAMALGILWVGQGLNIIVWPSSSFMLGQTLWAFNGAALSLFGVALVYIGRRI